MIRLLLVRAFRCDLGGARAKVALPGVSASIADWSQGAGDRKESAEQDLTVSSLLWRVGQLSVRLVGGVLWWALIGVASRSVAVR